nr:hypothetical protein [Tanacetum cinerariifolium]
CVFCVREKQMLNPSPPLHLVLCSSESRPSILLETLGISSVALMKVLGVGRGCFAVQRYGRRGGKKVYEFWVGKGNQFKYGFMAQIVKVLSKSDESSSSAKETIAEIAYYTSKSESESEFETLEYYDNSSNYGLFVNNDDD